MTDPILPSPTTAAPAPAAPSDEPKPGYKTTEFWLTTAAMIVGALMASGLIHTGSQADQIIGMAAMVLSKLGYTVSRAMVKK